MEKSRASNINKITVSYDTENEIFLIKEEYRDSELGVTVRFSSIESKEEVRESIQRFKKSFANK